MEVKVVEVELVVTNDLELSLGLLVSHFVLFGFGWILELLLIFSQICLLLVHRTINKWLEVGTIFVCRGHEFSGENRTDLFILQVLKWSLETHWSNSAHFRAVITLNHQFLFLVQFFWGFELALGIGEIFFYLVVLTGIIFKTFTFLMRWLFLKLQIFGEEPVHFH